LRLNISEGGAGRRSAVASIGDVGVTPGGLRALDYRAPGGGSVLSQPRPAPGIETERASEASQVAAELHPWIANILAGATSFLPPPLSLPALGSKYGFLNMFGGDSDDESGGDTGLLGQARADVGAWAGRTLNNIGSFLPSGETRKYPPLDPELMAGTPGVQPSVSSDPSTWPILPRMIPTPMPQVGQYGLGPRPGQDRQNDYAAAFDPVAARYARHYAQGLPGLPGLQEPPRIQKLPERRIYADEEESLASILPYSGQFNQA
jgi:hypothetical protein